MVDMRGTRICIRLFFAKVLPTAPYKKRNEHRLLIKSSPMQQSCNVVVRTNECASRPTYWFTMCSIEFELGSDMATEISFLDLIFLFAIVNASNAMSNIKDFLIQLYQN